MSQFLNTDLSHPAAAWGILFLRVTVGLMIFLIHGCHKLVQATAYFRKGTPWKLAEEVAAMRFPMPLPSALAATLAQFVFSAMLMLGLFTRLSALMLVGTLAVAILQNLLAKRDPQLALLYTLVAAAFVLTGGGPYSLDALLFGR